MAEIEGHDLLIKQWISDNKNIIKEKTCNELYATYTMFVVSKNEKKIGIRKFNSLMKEQGYNHTKRDGEFYYV